MFSPLEWHCRQPAGVALSLTICVYVLMLYFIVLIFVGLF
jgi:hypothetical protein